jgi:ABC-type sugar transport system ATPase subunit
MHRQQMRARAADLLRELGASFETTTPVARLGLAERQIVAIARALSRNARLCILDEPTAALGSRETDRLFAMLRHLRDRGAGVIYISHRLDEVLAIADRVTIVRDGSTTDAIRVAGVTREALISQVVLHQGPDRQTSAPVSSRPKCSFALQVEHLSRRSIFDDVSFQIAAGEIYGLAGLTGSGRTRIARGIFGVDPLDSGLIRVYGRPVRIRSPREAIKAGIGMLTEDREVDGLILRQPASENVALPIWDRIAHAGLVTPQQGLRLAARLIVQLGVNSPAQSCTVAGLSGGNQQKVVLAKWFATLPKVLILDEPLRGVDITAKVEICTLIRYLAAQGIGLLVICSELPELLNLADRIGVVREGRIVSEFNRTTATQELVFQCALGVAAQNVRGDGDSPPAQGAQQRRYPWPGSEAERSGMGLQPCP